MRPATSNTVSNEITVLREYVDICDRNIVSAMILHAIEKESTASGKNVMLLTTYPEIKEAIFNIATVKTIAKCIKSLESKKYINVMKLTSRNGMYIIYNFDQIEDDWNKVNERYKSENEKYD